MASHQAESLLSSYTNIILCRLDGNRSLFAKDTTTSAIASAVIETSLYWIYQKEWLLHDSQSAFSWRFSPSMASTPSFP